MTAQPPATPSRESRETRPIDIVVWGASGYTGQLVAEYLVRRHGVVGAGPASSSLRWALGGRSRDKLEAVRRTLARIDPQASELPIVLGDSHDRASLDAIARQTRVVATTVGPYSVHGRELVAACVEAGTDYCDLTGETPFIRDMIDRHHARAAETGARIVHCCGFDSVPSDLGTRMLQEHAQATTGRPCREVRNVIRLRGGMSGGTAASMVHVMEEASHDRRVRSILVDPHSLEPGRGRDRGARGPRLDGDRDPVGVHWDPDLRRWTAPFIMAVINTRVVRRTNALLGYAWGEDFRYRETMGFGSGARGLAGAAGMSLGLAAGFGALALPPVRRLIAKRVPSPGEGPSPDQRARGFFVAQLVGTLDGGGGGDATRRARAPGAADLRATVRGTSDPGYGETAKMFAESALCLALDGASGATPGRAISSQGGVLTPAACMGMRLVERLRDAGMTFAVE